MPPDSPLYRYQVGGSLRADAPSYVTRQADQDLYRAIRNGEFCYILNARQVGKSSLRVRTKAQLEAAGYCCASIDMTSIGSENLTPQQWYKGLLAELWRGFGLGAKVPFKPWWLELENMATLQVLHHFIDDVLLAKIPGRIVIFIDEIDSILSLPFSVGDFFAFIRFCYDHRSDDPNYNRLVFALFGVATPADLIRTHTRTPFNIGQAIDLGGFSLKDADPLAQGLVNNTPNPEVYLQEILAWTGGQPFLTQKLCQRLNSKCQELPNFCDISRRSAKTTIQELVQDAILTDWERQDEPEHLKTIRDRVLHDPTRSGRLLGIYQQILQGEQVATDDSTDQMELLLSGLIIKQHSVLKVKCRVYETVFNLEWVQRQLNLLRPYAAAIQNWAIDPVDESWLLRGRALAEAQAWADGKRLGDLDYRFIAASEALDRRIMEDALQLERAKETAIRLAQEKQSNRRQKRLIAGLTGMLGIALGLGVTALLSYQWALKSEQKTAIAAVQTKASSAQALFGSDQRLDALIAAVEAKRDLDRLQSVPAVLSTTVDSALRKAVYQALEKNRFVQGAELRAVDIRADGQMIASAAVDGSLSLWEPSGQRVATFQESQTVDGIFGMKFSPAGDTIATVSGNGTVKLWNLEGKILWSVQGHQGSVHAVAFSPDGQRLATAGADQIVKIWNRQGKLLQILKGHTGETWSVAFSPDGQLLATGSRDRTVKLWTSDGSLSKTLTGYQGAIRALVFSPDGQTLVTGSDDKTVRLWRRNGNLITAYRAHDDAVQAIAYAANGKFFVTGSWDNTLRIWNPEGALLRELRGHRDRVWTVALSPDGFTLVSGSWDQTVRLWQFRNPLTTPLIGHTAAILSVAFSPDGMLIASASDDRTVRLWNIDGTMRSIFRGHQGEVYGVAFSPDGREVASSSLDRTIKQWTLEGQLLTTLTGHQADIWGVAYSPNGQQIASASHDGTARLWSRNGQLLHRFQGHQSRVQRVAFSPDSRFIATASSDHTAKLWSLDGTEKATFQGHTSTVLSVNFSPDGQTLATASMDRTIKLWHLDGRLIRTLTGHTDSVSDVKFSPDGKLLASASFDGSVKIWRPDGSLVSTLEGHRGRVWHIAFSPKGHQLTSAGEDKIVLVWNLDKVLDVSHIQPLACQWLYDYLQTNAELSDRDRRLCQKNRGSDETPCSRSAPHQCLSSEQKSVTTLIHRSSLRG